MKLLRAADRSPMPWKNGGGVTTGIAVSPEGADLSAFDWRISMAHVAADGPFSVFPGVDRTLAVIAGNGIRLETAGLKPVDLTTTSEPVSFGADLPTMARLIGGPILDLNVMTRRGTVVHAVKSIALARDERLRIEHAWPLIGPGTNPAVTLVFCNTGSLRVEGSTPSLHLERHDALLLDRPATTELIAVAPAKIYRVTLTSIGRE
jgi:uncharacterized protein